MLHNSTRFQCQLLRQQQNKSIPKADSEKNLHTIHVSNRYVMYAVSCHT